MTDKHTPGPWHVDADLRGTIKDSFGDTIAIAGKNVDRAPVANARLIAAAPEMLEALEELREDLQARLDAAMEGATVADGLLNGEDANRSWLSWLSDVMRTHGDIARAAIKAAKGDA